MTEKESSEPSGRARETLRTFLKYDLPEASEQSWVCPAHQDPAAMTLMLRARYVCTRCMRDGRSAA